MYNRPKSLRRATAVAVCNLLDILIFSNISHDATPTDDSRIRHIRLTSSYRTYARQHIKRNDGQALPSGLASAFVATGGPVILRQFVAHIPVG
eukprot:6175179-Pleurochrysis_carterae.AAC.1